MISSKPSKQRKLVYNLPNHLRYKLLTARLSEDLEKQYGIKRISIRKGDSVKLMRGSQVGYEGKVVEVDRKRGRVAIEGLTKKKADGTPVYVWVHASKVIITKLDTGDKERMDAIERKRKMREEYFSKKSPKEVS
ncbi:50S ribosomal protein L24 [Sulfolobus acidocaldarius]|uniref:Large ribosomal subunit protein uL24 n=5 Tax=Sulfolobus acidocaldarius TaxID=2285 RepID=RL24_SULAC|nr:50S ribosomal protein L24 [Sulfolobus acidocaldarius]O05633.2 RecName: Full=Large ribosomal subunit protein uL24; AltName: Full=50S ribosomal protein L24 [Sulfolobus acidocaldarius DSM 639]AAY79978.1 50S ribosomal protein L24AB [Sulfolobus acidocaldarius DSM 639]AGE70547.1 50S ribosomal protein L24P [Sulfolobus acidocaldarius N8]AGE72820.1 50S ribosomal protein L24P [Sulfolobus acidocaldarius Ron12/I]ALU29094.1 50S ribosomal protein L24 [Sulfolobus acidocaldarius]ALU31820.1 50S ribosomal p